MWRYNLAMDGGSVVRCKADIMYFHNHTCAESVPEWHRAVEYFVLFYLCISNKVTVSKVDSYPVPSLGNLEVIQYKKNCNGFHVPWHLHM